MLDDLLILIGRFHPLIIHLPIGFIVLGILIELNSKKLKWSNDALKFIFFWATITGILSIISGYLTISKWWISLADSSKSLFSWNSYCYFIIFLLPKIN